MTLEFKLPNIRHLNALQEVARHRRVGIAAEKVHMSQPAVTQAVAKLEQTIGAQLFERRSNGMFPTQIGELFTGRTGRTLDHLKSGEQQAQKIAERLSKTRRRNFYKLTTAAQLQSIVAIAQTGNYSHAARQLGISQPAVYRAAKELEKLSGIKLFDQIRRGVTLTPAAEIFVHHVRLAMAEIRQGFYEIEEYLGRDSTVISVGSLPLSRTSILPNAIDALLQETENKVQIRNIDGPYATLLRDLRFGDVDFIIGALRDPPPADDVIQETLFNDPLSIVVGAKHPLLKRRSPTLKDTLAYPWIAPPRSTPTGTYLYDTLKIPESQNTPVRIVSSSLILLRGLMMRKNYITIMSSKQIEVENEQGLLFPLPIELKNSARSIGLTFRMGWKPTSTQNRFIDLIRDEFRNA
ncbi:MAG: LysR family transcriptional regulator [Methyloligellaceae bacterium]